MSSRPGPFNARRLFAASSVAIVVWAAVIVPLPFVEYVPGEPTDVAPLIEFSDVDVTELDGRSTLLTVVLRQRSTVHAVAAWLDGGRTLHRIERIYPPDLGRDEYLQLQRERFGRQFEIAAAVGARTAGFPTELVTEVVVIDTVEGSPAYGVLGTGDVITAVDGTPIAAAEELQSVVRAAAVGDEVVLEVVRDGDRRTERIRLGQLPGEDGPRIGVAIHTAVDELRLPFEIRLAENTRIGGPSAGLMVGLTVYDLLADEDLLAGRTIAGTGTLDADGSVGPVGGVPEKIRSAVELGADVVFVPESQLDQAVATGSEVTVVGVATLDEAIEHLRATG